MKNKKNHRKLLNKFSLFAAVSFCLFLSSAPLAAQDTSTESTELTTEEQAAEEEVVLFPGLNPDFLEGSFLDDLNLDGIVQFAAFGDSLVRGTGDFNAAGIFIEVVDTPTSEAGFPLRIENLLQIPVRNFGDPGERLSREGLERFARVVPGSGADTVFIQGGSNDAFDEVSENAFFHSVQTMINIANANGIRPILVTTPPSCCDRAGVNFFTTQYNIQVRTLSSVNGVPLADTHRAFQNTCQSGSCRLLNRPEGLHPNIDGYNVMGETVIAAVLNIDLFAPDGPANLELALNLPAGTVRTQPDPIPVTPEAGS